MKKGSILKRIPLVIHPFNEDVDNFINVNGVTLQNLPLKKFGKMKLSEAKEKLIVFDFLQAFKPWDNKEAGLVEKILSFYKTMCKMDKRFNTKCLFVGNPTGIREIMRITQCPSKTIMLAETLESAALMTKLSAN